MGKRIASVFWLLAFIPVSAWAHPARLSTTFGHGHNPIRVDFRGNERATAAVNNWIDAVPFVVGGTTASGSGNRDIFLTSRRNDGMVDGATWVNGKLRVDLGGDDELRAFARSVGLDASEPIGGGCSTVGSAPTPVIFFVGGTGLYRAWGDEGVVRLDGGGCVTSVTTGDALGNVYASIGDPTPAGLAGRQRVVKLSFSGKLDTTYGLRGDAVLPADLARHSIIASVLALRDGAVIGLATRTSPPGARDLVVFKLTKEGVIDPTFGVGGQAAIDSGSDDLAAELLVTESGRAIVSGIARAGTAQPLVLVARLSAAGSPESSFGTGGVALVNAGPVTAVRGLDLGGGAGIYVGAERPTSSVIVRLLRGGAPDTAFAPRGTLKVPFMTHLAAIMVQRGHFTGTFPQERTVVVGSGPGATADDLVLAAYNM